MAYLIPAEILHSPQKEILVLTGLLPNSSDNMKVALKNTFKNDLELIGISTENISNLSCYCKFQLSCNNSQKVVYEVVMEN